MVQDRNKRRALDRNVREREGKTMAVGGEGDK